MKPASRHRHRAEAVTLSNDEREERDAQRGGGDEHPADVPDLRLRFDLRPDHETGRVDEAYDGQAVRVAQLQKPCGLVGGIGVDRAAEMRGIVGEEADRLSLDAPERGQDAAPEPGAKLQHRVRIEQQPHQSAHVVDA